MVRSTLCLCKALFGSWETIWWKQRMSNNFRAMQTLNLKRYKGKCQWKFKKNKKLITCFHETGSVHHNDSHDCPICSRSALLPAWLDEIFNTEMPPNPSFTPSSSVYLSLPPSIPSFCLPGFTFLLNPFVCRRKIFQHDVPHWRQLGAAGRDQSRKELEAHHSQ